MNKAITRGSPINFAKKLKQFIVDPNPDLDYLEFDHMEYTRVPHGQFKKVTDSTKLNFECRISMIYQTQDGQQQKMNLYYITTDHQSLSLTMLDLDALARCYSNGVEAKLVYARSIVKPLLTRRLNDLIERKEVDTSKHNVRVEFIDGENQHVLSKMSFD